MKVKIYYNKIVFELILMYLIFTKVFSKIKQMI